MGEALLQRALDARMGAGTFLVTSAGIGADDGHPPSQGTVRAMEVRGIDVRGTRSTHLRQSIADGAWRVYCMEEYQASFVRSMLPAEAQKVMLLGGEEVPDPLGSGQQAYENVARQIERLLPGVVQDIAVSVAAEDGVSEFR